MRWTLTGHNRLIGVDKLPRGDAPMVAQGSPVGTGPRRSLEVSGLRARLIVAQTRS